LISTRGRISEATRIAVQEALEEENKKDTPSFGREDLEEIHRFGTETGRLGIYNFPGSVYATEGSNNRGSMGAGFFKLEEHRGGCCQLGRGEEGNFFNMAELGAAYLALEDSKRQQDRKLVILLSDSACQMSRWTGEGKSPSKHGNPDADTMRDIIQVLQKRIEQGLFAIFIKMKAHRGDPLTNKQTDGQMKEDKARVFAGPSHQTDQSSTGLTMAQHTGAP